MLKNGRVREECAQTRYGPKRMPSLPVESKIHHWVQTPLKGFGLFFFFFLMWLFQDKCKGCRCLVWIL